MIVEMQPGRALFESNQEIFRAFTGEEPKRWDEISNEEKEAWDDFAAEIESQDREEE